MATQAPASIHSQCTALAALLEHGVAGLIKTGFRKSEAEYLEPHLQAALRTLRNVARYENAMREAIIKAKEEEKGGG
jgi:peptide subunit release factor 1 (eRF1)